MIHIDIKKLGRFERVGHRITGDRIGQSSSRGIGWEYLHLAIYEHSRLACSEIHPDEQRGSCLAFLFNALRFFRRHGIRAERVMTDNGAAFRSRRYAKALRRLGIAHKRTWPYIPKTNGKAECFVQTSMREWAYARAYDTSEQRGRELPAFLFRYNWQRPHKGINGHIPISRLGLTEDNLLRLHTKRGFVLLPRRWVVERSFAWATRCRRLVKDHERYASTLAGLHRVAFVCLMLKQAEKLMISA